MIQSIRPTIHQIPALFHVSKPHEWKNTTALAIPTIAIPPPIKCSINLAIAAPFAPIDMLSERDKEHMDVKPLFDDNMSRIEFETMSTSILSAELVLD